MLVRELGELPQPFGQEGLVGGDDALAVRERAFDERPCRLHAAHDLDDDVGAVHQRFEVIGDQCGVDALACLRRVTDTDADEFHASPDPRLELVRLRREDSCDLGSHDSSAQQGDLH